MYIADMHCDSLLTVNSEKGLISEYNTSKSHPVLQFFAAFTPRRSRTPEMRRRDVMRYLDIYAYECERLSLFKIEDVRGLCYATDNALPSAMFTLEGGGGLLAEGVALLLRAKPLLRPLARTRHRLLRPGDRPLHRDRHARLPEVRRDAPLLGLRKDRERVCVCS